MATFHARSPIPRHERRACYLEKFVPIINMAIHTYAFFARISDNVVCHAYNIYIYTYIYCVLPLSLCIWWSGYTQYIMYEKRLDGQTIWYNRAIRTVYSIQRTSLLRDITVNNKPRSTLCVSISTPESAFSSYQLPLRQSVKNSWPDRDTHPHRRVHGSSIPGTRAG